MKKNDLLIYGSTLAFSFLFYMQNLGVNLSIFSLILLVLTLIANPESVKNKNTWIVFVLSIISAGSVAYYGNTLSILANIICLLLLFGMTFSAKTSVLVGLVNGLYTSFLGTYLYIFSKVEEGLKSKEKETNEEIEPKQRNYKWGLILIPVIIVVFFFTLYRTANPIFKNLTDKIDLSWISFAWISFTLVGYYFLHGAFQQNTIASLTNFEDRENWKIDASNVKPLNLGGKLVAYKDEFFTAKIMFILLNVLI